MRMSLSPAILVLLCGSLWAAAAVGQVPGGDGRPGAGPSATAMTMQVVGEGMVRFFAPGTKPEDALPSMALVKPLVSKGEPASKPATAPFFAKTADGRWAAHIETAAGTSLYGTGEVGGPLLRNDRTVTLWNTDAFGYAPDAPSLYQSHPWVFAVRADGTCFGVLADTTWRTEINLEKGITITSEGPAFPVTIIERKTPQELCMALATLTGTMPMPPMWAIGYHQCRYSYNPEAKVREVAANFRSRNLPCDVIWFDIDYMAGYRVFTFDPREFFDPTRLNADLENDGFRTIWMIDPGMKVQAEASPNDPTAGELNAMKPEVRARWDAQIKAYDAIMATGDAKNVWVKDQSGKVFKGPVWPGTCHFPDYTSDTVRQWWAGLYKDFMATGIDGVWNDMNEPAVFNVSSKTMPETNLHTGGKWQSGPGMPEVQISAGPHARFHNVYGMLMAQGTRDGIAALNPDKRPFVLTRAGYLGSHRYAATWTGDNTANWNDSEQSISMVLNLGLSGQPLSGPDIGGFNGNGPAGSDDKAKAALFARWFGFGTLLPFARGHTAKGNIDKEPWSFGPEVENTCRLALERRYRLLPYFYTLFHEASVTGMPVARPVFFADPTDPALRSEDDSFLIGSGVLVQIQGTPARDRVSVMPAGIWRPFELVGPGPNRNTVADKDLPAMFLKGGTILPVGPIVQSTAIKSDEPLTLYISPDEFGKARGTLYEDAGDGFGYTKGEYRLTTYEATCDEKGCTVKVVKTEGSLARPKRTMQVEVVTDGRAVRGSGTDGEPITVAF